MGARRWRTNYLGPFDGGYKIHLGSGNILMEPHDQYLCIVPKQSEQAHYAFLPDGPLSGLQPLVMLD